MRKYNFISAACVFGVFTAVFSTNAYAASFYIDPQTFSYAKVMPIVIGIALVIEPLIIMLFSKVRRIVNVSFAVLLANVASFLIIRVFLGALRHKFFYSGPLINGTSLTDWLVPGLCFVVTLGVELPIIWFSLKPFTPQKTRLIWCAAAANTVSFIVVTVFELYINNLLIK